MVRYDGEKFPLYLNVGKGLNDRKYHIYDITKTIRDTANRINGFERPKPNEGYALENGISDNSITHTRKFVSNQNEKSFLSDRESYAPIFYSHMVKEVLPTAVPPIFIKTRRIIRLKTTDYPPSVMKATAPKPNSPSCGEETILSELLRFLAAWPSGLVEATGIEPVSENPFTQFSPGAVYLQSSLPSSKQTKARGGILFMHDR